MLENIPSQSSMKLNKDKTQKHVFSEGKERNQK